MAAVKKMADKYWFTNRIEEMVPVADRMLSDGMEDEPSRAEVLSAFAPLVIDAFPGRGPIQKVRWHGDADEEGLTPDERIQQGDPEVSVWCAHHGRWHARADIGESEYELELTIKVRGFGGEHAREAQREGVQRWFGVYMGLPEKEPIPVGVRGVTLLGTPEQHCRIYMGGDPE